MNLLLKTTLIGMLFGTFGTTIGGIIGAYSGIKSNKVLSFILQFAAGLMIAIICLELIPESLELTNISCTVMGIILGVICMILCDIIINKKMLKNKKTNTMLKTGIIVGIALAIHNFPEGLAIGTSLGNSIKLGYALAFAIAFHDIPEGISMAVPMRYGGMKKNKIILYTMLSGITTGIGALFGGMVANISKEIIGISLAFAAGCMLYIVSGELIPESNKIHISKVTYVGNIIGFLTGIIIVTEI